MPGTDQLAFDLAAISARLRDIGEGGLTRELSQAIGKAVAPVEKNIRDGLPPKLPDRYAAELDDSITIGRRTTTTIDEAQVTVYATNKGIKNRKLSRLDAGILWHPVFGRFPRGDPRNQWREQSVTPGWFTQPAQDSAPQVREAISQALDVVAEKAAGK